MAFNHRANLNNVFRVRNGIFSLLWQIAGEQNVALDTLRSGLFGAIAKNSLQQGNIAQVSSRYNLQLLLSLKGLCFNMVEA